MDNFNNYCALPFRGMQICSDGTLKPCCMYLHDENTKIYSVNEIVEWWNHGLSKDRQSFKDKNPPMGCSRCFDTNYQDSGVRINFTKFLVGQELNYSVSDTPEVIDLSFDNICNLKCIMCENIKSVPWELPDNTKNEIIELMPYLEQVNWLGGEVFLYKHFDELFDIAHKYNVKQIISTNALLLSDKVIEKLVDYNVELSI